MAVGRHRAKHLFAGGLGAVEIDAVQIVARLLGRDRELRVGDQPLQLDRGQFELVPELAGGEIGEVGGGQALQEEARAAGTQHQLPGIAGRSPG